MNALQKEVINTFFQTLEDIKTKKDFETFFKDFFNSQELETYAKRLAIAYWLKKKRSYENIIQNLHASLIDVKKTEKLMNTPGIKLALKKMEAEEWSNKWAENFKKVLK